MGTIITEIDQAILLKTVLENTQTQHSLFQQQIKTEMNLIDISHHIIEDVEYTILKAKANTPMISSSTPKKLGKFAEKKMKKIKNSDFQLSACSNSRIIDFRVLQQTQNSVVEEKGKRQQGRKFILKRRNIVYNDEVLGALENHCYKGKPILFKNSLNMLKYKKTDRGSFCSTRSSIQALFQYEGAHTLDEQLSCRNQFFSIYQIMKMFKFFIGTIRQFQQHNLICPVFSLSHVILSQKDHSLKYKNIIDLKYFQSDKNKKIFYCPENLGRGKLFANDEKESVFSFGMCMIAVCLLEDLSDCYDYERNAVCVSLLEHKIDELRNKNQYEYWLTFCDTLQAMISPNPHQRPTLRQISQQCNQFLSQMRIYDCDTTQMMLSEISTCYNKGNSRPIKIFNGLQDGKYECISGRSCQKQLKKVAHKNSEVEFSGSKCLTARWNTGSNYKQNIEYSNKSKKDAKYEKLYLEGMNIQEKQNIESNEKINLKKLSSFEEIDRKWKSQDQLFRDMPQFPDLIDQHFMFNVNEQSFSKLLSRRPSEAGTLLTYRN